MRSFPWAGTQGTRLSRRNRYRTAISKAWRARPHLLLTSDRDSIRVSATRFSALRALRALLLGPSLKVAQVDDHGMDLVGPPRVAPRRYWREAGPCRSVLLPLKVYTRSVRPPLPIEPSSVCESPPQL